MSRAHLRKHITKEKGSPYWNWVGANGGKEPIDNFPNVSDEPKKEDEQLEAILEALNAGAMDEFTSIQRQVWQYVVVEGKTQEETAALLGGVEQSTVSRALSGASSIVEKYAQKNFEEGRAERISQNRKNLKELADLAAKFKIGTKKQRGV